VINQSASYYRARYYDASTGRFDAEDLLQIFGGINFYVYTANSPTMFTDPTGLDFSDCNERCFNENILTVSAAAGAGAYAAGQPIIPKPFAPPGMSGATSPASKFFSNLLRWRLPFKVPTPTSTIPGATSRSRVEFWVGGLRLLAWWDSWAVTW
jgi:uncharacterized protein RhaS with RHS repeats